MLTIFTGPLALVLFPLLWALVAILLRKQNFALWAAIVLGFFVEIGAGVFVVMAAINLSEGKDVWGNAKAS